MAEGIEPRPNNFIRDILTVSATESNPISLTDIIAMVPSEKEGLFYVNDAAYITDFPSALTSIGATLRCFIRILKFGGITILQITACKASGKPCFINGFYVASFVWGNVLD